MASKLLHSPYLLALLVGLYPGLFYISNNWFMFKPSLSLFLVGILALSTFFALGLFYRALHIFIRPFAKTQPNRLINGLFIGAAFLVWAYLLRQTLSAFFPEYPFMLYILVLMLAVLLGWLSRNFQFYHVNTLLLILCITSLGNGTISFISAEQSRDDSQTIKKEDRDLYQTVRFTSKPNIYYLVPDGYPNQEALQTIFHFDNSEFYNQLEALGFTIHHDAYSNYVSTIASIMATFGMEHHYYKKSYGNNEMLGARELIGGKDNPLAQIVTNNGYQIHYIHQTDYLLKMGCYIDVCSPSVPIDDLLDFLFPTSIKKRLGFMIDRSLDGLEARMLEGISRIAASDQPHFVYSHFMKPGHSGAKVQSEEGLKNFRETFFAKTKLSNQTILTLIQHILAKDPDALIILNSDHGGFGLGWYGIAPNKVFEGLSTRDTALDHVGVLLALRAPKPGLGTNMVNPTNINLFRYVFAFVSGNEALLSRKAPDNSYLKMGGEEIFTVVQDGKLLNQRRPYP